MITIGKEFKWEMSHRLPFHQGPCKNIHGHSYKMEIILCGEANDNSMVIDYYDIDRIVRPLVNSLDHAFLCDSEDKLLIDFLAQNNFKYLVMNNVSTAENITSFILDNIKPEFEKFSNIKKIAIKLFETEDAFCERSIELG